MLSRYPAHHHRNLLNNALLIGHPPFLGRWQANAPLGFALPSHWSSSFSSCAGRAPHCLSTRPHYHRAIAHATIGQYEFTMNLTVGFSEHDPSLMMHVCGLDEGFV